MPWETDQAKEYSKESSKYFRKKPSNIRIHSGFVGHSGEIAFNNLLKKDKQERIKEWASAANKYGNYYDFLVSSNGKEFTIDVKTTEKSDIIKTPEECNFLWGFKSSNTKVENGIKFCDFYVQMFYDEEDLIYFVGALSRAELMKYLSGEKTWWKRQNGFAIIQRETMDMTDIFLEYFSNESRLNTELQKEVSDL